MAPFKNEQSFTLIELVIVVGILAILAVVVIIVLNPSEFLKQARDSNRLSDLQTINSVIGQYQADGGTSIGSSNTVYVSIPSSQGDCSDLGLPSLPDDWFYACSSSDNYRKVTGNGWIPINLTSVSYGSPLDALPIDPINSTSTGDYYTYVTGGSWELNGILESSKYRTNTSITKQNLPGVFAVGSNLTLSPIFNNSGLVGYWKFDEGSGTSASDSSGNNTGTLTNGPTWTTGKVGNALSFDGTDDYVLTNPISTITFNEMSGSVWIKSSGTAGSGYDRFFSFSAWNPGFIFAIIENSGGGKARVYLWDNHEDSLTSNISINDNAWHYITFVWKAVNGSISIYIDGILDASKSSTVNTLIVLASGGKYYMGYPSGYYGLIDDVRIYNRALSAAEIAAIYNATK